jgi:hypothetical protein
MLMAASMLRQISLLKIVSVSKNRLTVSNGLILGTEFNHDPLSRKYSHAVSGECKVMDWRILHQLEEYQATVS